MKQISVIGYVGQDATVHQNNGDSFVSFSVSHNEKDSAGNEVVDWFNCTTDKIKLAPHIKKGMKVFVQGKLWVKMYKANGKENISQNIKVFQFEFCDTANK